MCALAHDPVKLTPMHTLYKNNRIFLVKKYTLEENTVGGKAEAPNKTSHFVCRLKTAY
jgi:hypothetical protein